MATTKKPKYLSPRSLLTKKEYQDYSTMRKIPQRDRLQAEIEQRKADLKRYNQEKKYEDSRTGRFARKTTGFLSNLKRVARQGATRSLYARKTSTYTRPETIKGSKQGYTGRGRPRGTYDQRYAAYGGVYGWRKAMAQKRRMEFIQYRRNLAINPRQQEVLRQMEIRDNIQQRSPESRTIPDTYGKVPTKSIFQEIDDASNLFP